jgi:peptide/nickel transport system substrate-binding protein
MILPENPVILRAGYSEIESVATPDDTTVVVTYRRPYAPYREHFLWILPQHVFGGNPAIDKHAFNRAPMGTGPFVFKSWESGTAIIVDRNPRYRDSGKPRLDSLIFKMIPSREVAIQSFKVGETDVIWNLAEPNIPEIEGITDAAIDPKPSSRVERLVLNTSCSSGEGQGQPDCPHRVLGDIRVRQAIELAIDKKSLVDRLLYGKASVATSVIPLGWFAPSLQPSEYNTLRARQLLDDAGWRSGADNIRTRDGVRARIEFVTTSGDQLREQTQQVIQEQLRDVGIEVELKTAPSAVVLGTWQDNAPRARGNFDMLMATFGAPGLEPHSFLQSNFHGSQIPTEQNRGGANFHRIIDPQIDRALDQGDSTMDEAQRKQAYGVVAERVNEGKGQIVLYSRLQLDAFKKAVKGWEVNVFSNNLAWDAANWWIDR